MFALSVTGWGFAAMGIASAKNLQEALLVWRLGYAFGVLWISATYYHFVCTFLGLHRRKSILLHYALGLMFLIVMPTRWFFKRVDLVWTMYFVRSGPLHYVFFIWWIGLVVYSHYLLLHALPSVSSNKKNQIKYFFLASLVGFTGGSLGFLNDFGIDIYPWGQFTVCLYPVVMSYAIVKHQLMDISVVIRKTLVYSAVTALLTALYVLITMGLARGLSGWVASPTAFSSAAAACAMALLFHPLRMKVQRFVDRHFFRESLDQAILREATSGFVHEIKRPLTNISLPAELSLMDLQDFTEGRRSSKEVMPKVLQRLQYILDQTSDAGDKIEALRGFSESNVKYSSEVNVSQVIRKSAAAERSLLERNGAALKLEVAENLPAIRGHEKQLEIVFSNLIKNAAEALGEMEGGAERSIGINVYQSEDAVMLFFKDSGPGIKEENISHLFEPYFTTKGSHGMGVGLYLCRQIIHSHGGTIEVETHPGRGTTFTIRLPAITPPAKSKNS